MREQLFCIGCGTNLSLDDFNICVQQDMMCVCSLCQTENRMVDGKIIDIYIEEVDLIEEQPLQNAPLFEYPFHNEDDIIQQILKAQEPTTNGTAGGSVTGNIKSPFSPVHEHYMFDVIVENKSQDKQKVELFNVFSNFSTLQPNFGNPLEIEITTTKTSGTYGDLLSQIEKEPIYIKQIRMYALNNKQLWQNILITDEDANNDPSQMSLCPNYYVIPSAYQDNIVDIEKEFVITPTTKIQFEILPGEQVKFVFQATRKKSISPLTLVAGLVGAAALVYSIKKKEDDETQEQYNSRRTDAKQLRQQQKIKRFKERIERLKNKNND